MEKRPHRNLIRVMLVVLAIVTVGAIFSLWVARQLLQESYWKETNTELIQDAEIRDTVAVFLVDELYSSVDVAAELSQRLPPELQPLAGPAAGAFRTAAERVAKRALATPAFQAAWSAAVTVTHKQFINLVEDKGKYIKTESGGAVILDLRPLLGELATRLGLSDSIANKIPDNRARIKIASATQVETAQSAAKWLKRITILLVLLLPVLAGLIIYLGRGRRRETLMNAAFVIAGGALLVLVLRRALGNYLVDALVPTASVKDAADQAYAIITGLLMSIGRVVLALALVLALAGWLAGPGRHAVSLRHRLRPAFDHSPEAVYGVVIAGLLVMVAVGIIPGIERPLGIFFLLLTAVVSVELVRRQALSEAPPPP